MNSSSGLRFRFPQGAGVHENEAIFSGRGTNARYLLVSTKGTGQAANQFELYGKLYVPVPEPVTMSLLALGGLAMLRRGRR